MDVINHLNMSYDSQNMHSVLNEPPYISDTIEQIDYKCKNGDFFIFPIVIFDLYLFENYDTIELPDHIVNGIKLKKGKLIIIFVTEPSFGVDNKHYLWMCDLSRRYNFNKESIIIITSNMVADKTFVNLVKSGYIIDNFTLFQYDVWSPIINTDEYEWFNQKNKNQKKKHHILCFNRVPKIHRIGIFGELMSNKNYVDKYILSMGRNSIKDEYMGFYDVFRDVFRNIDIERKFRISNYLLSYDESKDFIYDENDLMLDVGANTYNKHAHSDSFVNVVTESYLDENIVFYSEKTYKPIRSLQPFIIFGNTGSLKKLKERGYKTFEKWWDESYDDEIDMDKKFEKICKVMEEICSWDLDKCFRITNEMEETLQHNFFHLINTKIDDRLKLHNLLNGY